MGQGLETAARGVRRWSAPDFRPVRGVWRAFRLWSPSAGDEFLDDRAEAPLSMRGGPSVSGIVEVTELFAGTEGYDTAAYRYFLLDAQVHKNISATDPDLVELGQPLMMRVKR